LSNDFDGNEAFVLSIISFLEDVGWIKGGQDDSYVITDKGLIEGVSQNKN
jgi:hypothetical protein